MPIDDKLFFDKALKMLKPTGVIAMMASNPFAAYLIMNHLNYFKYEWVWEKDNGSNFVHVKRQPFKVHELILIFGKAPTTYNNNESYMNYNPQFTYSKPYSIKRDGSNVENLTGFKGRNDTNNLDGKRFPRTIQKFNVERGLHPTQKPTKLFEYMIKTYAPENGIIVDVCAGSGTTAVSAKNCGCNFIVNDNGFNKDNAKFADIIKKRILM